MSTEQCFKIQVKANTIERRYDKFTVVETPTSFINKVIDRTNTQKINKDMEDFSNTTKQLSPFDVTEHYHTIAIYTFFFSNIYIHTDHLLCQYISLKIFKRTEMIKT